MSADNYAYGMQWPFSGGVNQKITTPWFSPTFNFAGDARIEEKVVTEVASYGKQIGWLNDIVLALADNKKPPANALKQLKEAVKEIEDIKRKQKLSRLSAAVEALDTLRDAQSATYRNLIKERNEELGRP